MTYRMIAVISVSEGEGWGRNWSWGI